MKRSEKILLSFIGIILITFLIFQYILIRNRPPSSEEVILKKLEVIENQLKELSSKKDSIRVVINTIDREIINNEKHYEEITNHIISQPYSMDSMFITEFVDRFIETEGFKYNLYPVREAEY